MLLASGQQRRSRLPSPLALSGCGGGAMGPTPPIDKATYVPPQAELMAPGPLGERVLGKADAPVTVIEYVSLTCPHCANFQKHLFPRLKKEFIDTGKVRYHRARVPHRPHLRELRRSSIAARRKTNISSC